jgi:D-xylose transport system permease protein
MRSFFARLSPWIPLITLLALSVAFSLSHDAFLTDRNLTNLFRQVSVNCVLAFGMTLVILIGGIDLSVGSVLALCTVFAGLMQRDLGFAEWGLAGTALTGFLLLGSGALTGSSIGWMVSKLKMPAFVASLGLFAIARGLAHIFSESNQITGFSSSFRWIGDSSLSKNWSFLLLALAGVIALGFAIRKLLRTKNYFAGATQVIVISLVTLASIQIFYGHEGLPIPVLVTAVLFFLFFIALNQTIWGRSLYALGGNPEAARLCGIRVERYIFSVYLIMGVCVAIAAWIESGRLATADPRGGSLYELDAIAAVVIGGTSLRGGIGRIEGTLLGALLIGTLSNGMSLLNVESNYQNVIKGVIILGAVWIDLASKSKKS